jgi:hypothetical protein
MTTQLITILAAGLFAAAVLSRILHVVLRASATTMAERLPYHMARTDQAAPTGRGATPR